MKHCPNVRCAYATKHGSPATFGDFVQTCNDCDAVLAVGDPRPPTTSLPLGIGLDFAPADAALNKKAWALTFGLPIAMLAFALVLVRPSAVLSETWLNLLFARIHLGFSIPGSLLALNVTDFLAALFCVELACTIVPALKWRRESSAGRESMLRAAYWLTGVFALVHTGFLLFFAFVRTPFGVAPPSAGEQLLLGVGMLAASALSISVAEIVSRRFRLNGFSVFFLVLTGVTMIDRVAVVARRLETGMSSPIDVAIALGALGVLAVLTLRVFDERPLWTGRRGSVTSPAPNWNRFPIVGFSSVIVAGILPRVVSGLFSVMDMTDAQSAAIFAALPWSVWIFTAVAFVVLARLFWPSKRVAAAIGRATDTSAQQAHRETRVGLKDRLVKEGVLLAYAIFLLNSGFAETLSLGFSDVLFIVITVAVVLDVRAERMAEQRASSVRVGEFSRVWEASVLLETMERANPTVFVHVRGIHHRSLFQYFAPEIFLDVFTTEEDAATVTRCMEAIRAVPSATTPGPGKPHGPSAADE